jgi:hypothetical protein
LIKVISHTILIPVILKSLVEDTRRDAEALANSLIYSTLKED